MKGPAERQIKANRRRYRQLAGSYERRHGEIYNEVEQARLRDALARSLDLIDTGVGEPRVLDFGCGTGNLTSHLLSLGARVTAADLSPNFLGKVQRREGANERLATLQLNGRDLEGVPSASFDMVAVYSVLHHIPDYLAAVAELCRVLRLGGVLFIDHEAGPRAWEDGRALSEYRAAVTRALTPESWARFLDRDYLAGQAEHVYTHLRRRLGDRRFFPEGDLHVWPDDHIEWEAIEDLITSRGFEELIREDYLLYQRGTPADLYERYRGLAADTRLFVVRRRIPPSHSR